MTQSILIADDSLAIRRAIQDALHGDDYRLEFTGDGAEAVEVLEGVRHDLVIADLHMPGKSGYQVAVASKNQHPTVPVLLLIGTFEAFDASAFARCGADACLKKPFEAREIREQVQELLRPSPQVGASIEEPSSPEPGEEEPVAEEPVAEEPVAEEPVAEEPVDEVAAPGVGLEGSAAESEEPAPGIDQTASEAEEPAMPPSDLQEIVAQDREDVVEESAPASPETVDEPDAAAPVAPHTLSVEDIDQIARRVVEIAGDGVLREVAWEVVPDLAEVIIRERLEKLESELEESS